VQVKNDPQNRGLVTSARGYGVVLRMRGASR